MKAEDRKQVDAEIARAMKRKRRAEFAEDAALTLAFLLWRAASFVLAVTLACYAAKWAGLIR